MGVAFVDDHLWACVDYNYINTPDSKVHGANMGPIWGRQDPGGPHVGPMNFIMWDHVLRLCQSIMQQTKIRSTDAREIRPWDEICTKTCNVFVKLPACILNILIQAADTYGRPCAAQFCQKYGRCKILIYLPAYFRQIVEISKYCLNHHACYRSLIDIE